MTMAPSAYETLLSGFSAPSWAAAFVLLASCGTPRANIPFDPPSFQTPDPLPQIDASRIYRIGPSDVVTIAVFRAPEISGEQRVDDAGNISMPLIGAVHAQGNTTTELATVLRDRLGKRFYVNPDVAVTLKESPASRITVDGAVQAPGLYPIAGPATLVQAVALARGASEDANLRRVVVFRTIEGRRMAAAFDLAAIRNGTQPDPQVYRSDIIIVDGSKVSRIWRNILQALPIVAIFRPF